MGLHQHWCPRSKQQHLVRKVSEKPDDNDRRGGGTSRGSDGRYKEETPQAYCLGVLQKTTGLQSVWSLLYVGRICAIFGPDCCSNVLHGLTHNNVQMKADMSTPNLI